MISESAPAFHGLYRAITSTPFTWTAAEWERITSITSDLFAHEVVDRLNSLLPDYVNHADDNFRRTTFIRTVLSRYASSGRPLSGYFAVCGVIEIQWTILAQVLAPPLQQPPVASTSTGILPSSQNMEAQASNIAWTTLMSKPCGAPDPTRFTPYIMGTIRRALDAAAQCFADLLDQVEDFGEVDPEMYAFETMSQSLVCRPLNLVVAVIELVAEIGHRLHACPQRGRRSLVRPSEAHPEWRVASCRRIFARRGSQICNSARPKVRLHDSSSPHSLTSVSVSPSSHSPLPIISDVLSQLPYQPFNLTILSTSAPRCPWLQQPRL